MRRGALLLVVVWLSGCGDQREPEPEPGRRHPQPQPQPQPHPQPQPQPQPHPYPDHREDVAAAEKLRSEKEQLQRDLLALEKEQVSLEEALMKAETAEERQAIDTKMDGVRRRKKDVRERLEGLGKPSGPPPSTIKLCPPGQPIC